MGDKLKLLKAGDTIHFKIDDVKHEFGDREWMIFGNPLFDDELDMNVLVKTEVRTEQELNVLRQTNLCAATITSVSVCGTMPVYFVRYPMPLHTDKNKNTSTEEDIMSAIATGCGKCKGTMNFVEVADSIISKRKDGTFRTLCHKCLKESLAEMEANKAAEKVIAH